MNKISRFSCCVASNGCHGLSLSTLLGSQPLAPVVSPHRGFSFLFTNKNLPVIGFKQALSYFLLAPNRSVVSLKQALKKIYPSTNSRRVLLRKTPSIYYYISKLGVMRSITLLEFSKSTRKDIAHHEPAPERF
jgi:hypothetical protein